MKAVILAGGLGTRLRPVTYEIPKPLIPVQGRTLLEHIFDTLKQARVDEVYLAIGYMADKIMAYYGDGKNFGLKIKYLVEQKPLGTGGWMKLATGFRGNFFVLNGDNLFNIEFKDVLKMHIKNKAVATIALTKVEDVSSYGIVALEDDRILRFVEKPKKEEAPSNYANSGYYCFNEKVFDYVPDKESFMLEGDVFPRVASIGGLYGYKSEAQWFDTGTFERWEQVIKEWKK